MQLRHAELTLEHLSKSFVPEPRLIPTHIVAGPLGVGKTTSILDFVRRRAASEHIAVLVNDFGPVGMDGAILEGAAGGSSGGLEVMTIPGGCLCCASAEALATGIPKLAGLAGVTRIIIEPSGLAMPAQVVDLLRQLAAANGLDLRPTIVLLDAGEFRSEAAEHMPYYRRLVESADVLIANRADRADERSLARFMQWAKTLYPAKLRVLTTSHGVLPEDLFELQAVQLQLSPASKPVADEPHAHPERAGGAVWPPAVRFNLAGVEALLRATGPDRFKGILHTDAGWKLIQHARGELSIHPTEYRRDSRAEWIGSADATRALLEELNRCRL